MLEAVLEVSERVGETQPEPVDDGERVERPRARLVLADGCPDRNGPLRELTPTLEVALEPERVRHLRQEARLEPGVFEIGERSLQRLDRDSRAEAAGGELGSGAVGECPRDAARVGRRPVRRLRLFEVDPARHGIAVAVVRDAGPVGEVGELTRRRLPAYRGVCGGLEAARCLVPCQERPGPVTAGSRPAQHGGGVGALAGVSEVPGDLDGVVLGIRKRLQRARDIEVKLLTARCGNSCVRRPGIQRMREMERVIVALQDVARRRRLEMVHDRVRREVAGGGHTGGSEAVAEDGGKGERVLHRSGELGEAFGDGIGDLARTGGLELGNDACLTVLRVAPGELMDDVLDEERVAAGDAVHGVLDLARRVREPEGAHHLSGLFFRKRSERDLVTDLFSPQSFDVVRERRARSVAVRRGEHDGDRLAHGGVGDLQRQVGEQVE